VYFGGSWALGACKWVVNEGIALGRGAAVARAARVTVAVAASHRLQVRRRPERGKETVRA
jgi:hypothetical protein